MNSVEQSQSTIISFIFAPIEAEAATEILVELQMPITSHEYHIREHEIEDCIASYIDAVPLWSFEQLITEVTQSFDCNAKILKPKSKFII